MTVITASPTQFGKLLDLQRGLLDQSISQTIQADTSGQTLRNIRELTHAQLTGQKEMIDGIKEDVANKAQLALQKEQLIVAKEAAESIEKMAVDLRKQAVENAKIVTSIAGDMRLFKSSKEKLGDNFKNAFGSLSRTLDTLGIVKKGSGSIISNIVEKREERKNYVKDQKSLGSTLSDKQLAENFSKAQAAAKNIEQNENAISRFKKMGLNEAQIGKTEEGKALLEKRIGLSEEYSKYDLKSKLMRDDSNNTSEEEMEAQKTAEETKEVLAQIAENTKPKDSTKDVKPEKVEGKEGGGFLDGILGMFSGGFMKAIKAIFSPGNILKSLGKVFGITMIIGSLVNGLMDGFKEFAESGDIGKALIAGLGGVLEFLTFGLLDKETVKNIVDSVSGFVDEYIVKPLSDFFTNVKNGILEMISNIGIPEIKFKIPVINKEVSVGPYYPFKDAASPAKPKAVEPTAANQIESKSAENADAAVQGVVGGNNTAIVAPTVNNVTKQNQIIKTQLRNQDPTMGKYVNSRY